MDLLDFKIALPNYKNCIWVTLWSVKSIGYQDGSFNQRLLSVYITFLSSSIRYQDGSFELRTAFDDIRHCHALDLLWVLHFKSWFTFKSFYKWYFSQSQVLPSSTLSSIILHKLQKYFLTLCIFLQSPQTQHKLFSSFIIYLKALANRFVCSIITERLDKSFLCGIIFRPTYTVSALPLLVSITSLWSYVFVVWTLVHTFFFLYSCRYLCEHP